MADDASTKRLGRGLAALIGEMDKPESASSRPASDGRIPVDRIVQSKNNPRRSFSDAELDELARSIAEHGLIQPVVVRPIPTDDPEKRYEIVAGERRWRAAQRAGLADVPAIVRDVDDKAALELAIIENVQRSDLNAVEEAAGYQRLMDEYDYTQADLGSVIGKSRSHVANTLRLLKLPEKVQSLVVDGALSAGHARTLVTAEDPAALAGRIIRDGLSVRQAEAIANGSGGAPAKSGGGRPDAAKDADTKALERVLSDHLGLHVAINHKNSGGQVTIRYTSLDQLDEICRLLQRN